MVEKFIKLLFKIIFIGFIGLLLFNAYKYYPYSNERDKEAEVYFMNQLHKEMANTDTLETNLTSFTTFAWDDICFTYDKYGKLFEVTLREKGFIRYAQRYILDLSEYIDIDESYTHRIPKKVHRKNHVGIISSCTKRGANFILKKIKNSKNKYILDFKNNMFKKHAKKIEE